MHGKDANLYKSELAVKIDVPIYEVRISFGASGDSQLPPVLLPLGCSHWQVTFPSLASDTEGRLLDTESGLDGS